MSKEDEKDGVLFKAYHDAIEWLNDPIADRDDEISIVQHAARAPVILVDLVLAIDSIMKEPEQGEKGGDDAEMDA